MLLTPPSALATSEGHSAERVKLKFTRNKYKKGSGMVKGQTAGE